MDLLLEIENKLNIKNELNNIQENFLKKNWGEAINNAFDIGLKAVLPDYLEEEIIDVKNAFLKGGIVEAIKKAIDITITEGKEFIGIFTGNIKNIYQINDIEKNGELIKNIAYAIEKVIDKIVKNGLIKEALGILIKNGLNNILEQINKNVEKLNNEQIKKIERIENYINNWNKYLKQENFTKMQQEYKKIENVLPDVMPTEEIINKIESLKNIHNLIKNNGKNFNLTEEEFEVSKMLI